MRRTVFALSAALLLSLTACGPTAEDGTTASVPAESAPVSVSVPEEPTRWTDGEVTALLEEYHASVVDFQPLGGLDIVRYVQEFDLYETLAVIDREERELTPLKGDLMPEAKVATMDNSEHIFVLHPGTDAVADYRLWPTVERLFLPQNPVTPLYTSEEPYRMPTTQSFTVGNHHGLEELQIKRVELGADSIQFRFVQNEDGVFLHGIPYTPQMEVAFDGDTCTIIFPGVSMHGDFEVVCEEEWENTPDYRQAVDRNGDSVLTFSCPSLVKEHQEGYETRWYVKEAQDPSTGLPVPTLILDNHWIESYPVGW